MIPRESTSLGLPHGDYSYSISPKGTKSRTIVEDGRKIYPFLYAKGWELCLELFVRDDETWNRPDDPRNLLNEESSNPVEMHYVAMRDGYTQCMNGLEKLASGFPETELREALNLRPRERETMPSYLILGHILWVCLFLWWTIPKLIQCRQKTKNGSVPVIVES